MKKRIGILTGGGDAPGLNGIIEASVRTLSQVGYELVGICDGFEGVFEGRTLSLTREVVAGAHGHAGTLLGTSNRMGTAGREKEFLEKYKELNLKGLLVAGGDGTFSGLRAFRDEVSIIGVPKTIDNDLSGTEITFGYDTACSVVADAVDALRATAHAHRRVIFVETMGRTAGWIALGGGLASYADAILLPERPFSPEKLFHYLREKKSEQRGAVVVVSEGAHAEGQEMQVAFRVPGSPQEERLGGVSLSLAKWTERETEWESRNVVLGHLQRSRAPTPTDRFLTVAMGVEAARLVQEESWGKAVVFRGGRVTQAPIEDLMGPARTVEPDHRWVKLAQAVGIFV